MVQFGPTRLPTFGEDDWFTYTEIRVEAWFIRTFEVDRGREHAPLVQQIDHVQCPGDHQQCDLCQGLVGLDSDSPVEVAHLADSVVAPSDAVTVSPVVSDPDVLPSIDSNIEAKTLQPASASNESLVKEARNGEDATMNRTRYPVRDRDLNRVAVVPRKRISVDLDLDSDDEAREASEERYAKQARSIRRRGYLNTVVETWRKGISEPDEPAPSPIPRPPTPRQMQGLSIHLMPDTLEGWTALVGSKRPAPGIIDLESTRSPAAPVPPGSATESADDNSADDNPPSSAVDVEKAMAQAMFEIETLAPITTTWEWNNKVPFILQCRHVSAPTTPLPGRHEDRRVSFKSLLDWSPKERVDEDVLIPALTASSSSPTTGLSTPCTRIEFGVEATAMIEASRKLAEFQKMRPI